MPCSLLPGFKLLNWWSFFLGLIESFGYGWYVALIVGPLYNSGAVARLTSSARADLVSSMEVFRGERR